MSETRTRPLTFFAAALTLTAAMSVAVGAQEKDKETRKPPTSTADAWRQSLPPEAETDGSLHAEPNAAPPRASREEVEASLTALEREWMEAVKLRNASALSRIVSDDFTLVSPRLVVAAGDRDRYFNHVMRELSLASYGFEGLTVRLYGRAAVVSGVLKRSAAAAGEDWGGSFHVTDVWVNRDGFWRVVSRHESLLPGKK